MLIGQGEAKLPEEERRVQLVRFDYSDDRDYDGHGRGRVSLTNHICDSRFPRLCHILKRS